MYFLALNLAIPGVYPPFMLSHQTHFTRNMEETGIKSDLFLSEILKFQKEVRIPSRFIISSSNSFFHQNNNRKKGYIVVEKGNWLVIKKDKRPKDSSREGWKGGEDGNGDASDIERMEDESMSINEASIQSSLNIVRDSLDMAGGRGDNGDDRDDGDDGDYGDDGDDGGDDEGYRHFSSAELGMINLCQFPLAMNSKQLQIMSGIDQESFIDFCNS